MDVQPTPWSCVVVRINDRGHVAFTCRRVFSFADILKEWQSHIYIPIITFPVSFFFIAILSIVLPPFGMSGYPWKCT